jgi:hypothetical protein
MKSVIPAKAGIHAKYMDPGSSLRFGRNDR